MSEENEATTPETTAAAGPEEERVETPAAATEEVEAPSVNEVRLALRKVKDPELNLNIVDLGLVYDVAVEGRTVKVDMSLTSPACPSGPQLVADAERAVRNVPGVGEVQVNLVWQPLWTPDRIEPRVRAYMGL